LMGASSWLRDAGVDFYRAGKRRWGERECQSSQDIEGGEVVG